MSSVKFLILKSQHTPSRVAGPNQTCELIILGNVEKITCFDALLNLEHPTSKPIDNR